MRYYLAIDTATGDVVGSVCTAYDDEDLESVKRLWADEHGEDEIYGDAPSIRLVEVDEAGFDEAYIVIPTWDDLKKRAH